MLKFSRNQFKIIKETTFGQDKLNENFALKFAKLSKINSQISVATEAGRKLPNMKMGNLPKNV